MRTEFLSKNVTAAARIACAALVLVAASAAEALAQPRYVTGSANTDRGFSLVGYVHQLGGGIGAGRFMIVVHRDTPENGVAAYVCEYTKFTNVSIVGDVASFQSVGTCLGLTTIGGLIAFTSDNSFGITDNGEPGVGVDTVDVNFRGAGGVAVPGSFLLHGNFTVRP